MIVVGHTALRPKTFRHAAQVPIIRFKYEETFGPAPVPHKLSRMPDTLEPKQLLVPTAKKAGAAAVLGNVNYTPELP